MVTPSGSTHLHAYFHTNRQGSTVAMSNDAGTVSEGPYTYDAYGSGAPSTGVPFKYTGRRLDAETGLYYYRARYYSASLGRFLQTDPVGYADQMNLYAYVNNDPVNATDPMGLAGCKDMEGQGLSGECVDSDNFRENDEVDENGNVTKPNNKFDNDAVGTPSTDDAAVKQGEKWSSDGNKNEQGARIDENPDSSGASTTEIEPTSSSPKHFEHDAKDTQGADAFAHSHPSQDSSNSLVPGPGDIGPPADRGHPNYVTYKQAVVVVEISGGQVRVRVVRGTLSPEDRRALKNLTRSWQRQGVNK